MFNKCKRVLWLSLRLSVLVDSYPYYKPYRRTFPTAIIYHLLCYYYYYYFCFYIKSWK